MNSLLQMSGLLTAFMAGMVSFLSPCVLPLVPGYVSYVAGRSIDTERTAPGRLATVGLGFCFVLGFATVFVAMGAGASALSGALLRYRYEAGIVGGVVVILFGLMTTGILRLMPFQRDLRFMPKISGGTPLSAYVLGLAFAFGWTPCIGPVLGAILALTATSDISHLGIMLLATYAAGLGVPFLLVAAFADAFLRGPFRSLRRVGHVLQLVAGGVMVVMGVAMITGHLTDFAILMLQLFPGLGSIG
ncbi:cytochrome c biogenesis CcdA family protein [Roseomonas nepalensis]